MKKILVLLMIVCLSANCFAKNKKTNHKKTQKTEKTISLDDATYLFANAIAMKSGETLNNNYTYYGVTISQYSSFDILKMYINLVDMEYRDVSQVTAWNSDGECIYKVCGHYVVLKFYSYCNELAVTGKK